MKKDLSKFSEPIQCLILLCLIEIYENPLEYSFDVNYMRFTNSMKEYMMYIPIYILTRYNMIILKIISTFRRHKYLDKTKRDYLSSQYYISTFPGTVGLYNDEQSPKKNISDSESTSSQSYIENGKNYFKCTSVKKDKIRQDIKKKFKDKDITQLNLPKFIYRLDWICTTCLTLNFNYRDTCRTCKKYKLLKDIILF
eukprot:Mrub_09817.p1 GENE.Mrub_09817~~Mrub_09817.p1  ORF type:complete len:210 (+),score=4.41 Mrub_09817:42-632(+)